MIKRFLCLFLAVVMLAGVVPVFAAPSYEITYSTVLSNPLLKDIMEAGNTYEKNDALIYPPDTHPRIYLNEEYINFILEHKETQTYKENFEYLLGLANKELPPQPEFISTKVEDQLVARAMMYAFGQVSKSHAKETIRYTIEYMDNPKTDKTGTINIYKAFGFAMRAASFVYDWCYSAMTEAEKEQLAESIHREMYRKEQPFRPDNPEKWTAIGGKTVGYPMHYMSVAAVAIYERYPEVYDTLMAHIQGEMAEIVRIFDQQGALTDGTIAYAREGYALYTALLFDRMGYPNFYGDLTKVGYKMLYSRLPYGGIFKQGDEYLQNEYKNLGEYVDGVNHDKIVSMLSVLYDEPYLRYHYLKENSAVKDWEGMLITEKHVPTKLPDDLPLAYFIDEPKSEIMARTSWQDGMDSPAVSALMSIHNRRTGDHDHANIGDFQLYYKGPLTMPAGLYSGTGGAWGGPHWENYYSRSVSSNCMLVYDPSEIYIMGKSPVEGNDGGQLMVTPWDGSNVIDGLEEQMSDDNHWAITEAHYIGPNEITPAFSYIKGDITNSYSQHKMQNYKRGMVFMDTFNQTYPGVMVVYDRVAATSDKYDKKWLLQSVTEPVVEENKITIVNNQEGCNGKLVNTTLFPEAVDITKVGEVGKYMVNGTEYFATNDMSDLYRGGIRLEVSPQKEEKVDVFLNAMYVTDADGNAPELPMIKEETEKFVGVTTLDRTVLFSKDTEKVNEEFKFTVRDNGYENMLCFITDIAPGIWCIEGKDGKTFINADKDGYSLTFNAKPGEYKIYPAEDAEAQEFSFPEMPKEKIGDFGLKLDYTYSYVKNPNKLVDGVPYIAIADYLERYFGATTQQDGDILTITTAGGAKVILTAGQKDYDYVTTMSSQKRTMTEGAPFMENGVMYATLKGLDASVGIGNVSFEAHVPALYLTKGETVDENRVIWPQSITASSSIEGEPVDYLLDRNLKTKYSTNARDGEWITYDLGESKEITEVQIAWVNGQKRHWKFDILVSDDNVTYTEAIMGARTEGVTAALEPWKLPAGTKARYVRIVGHGEEVTNTLNFSPTEIIIMK